MDTRRVDARCALLACAFIAVLVVSTTPADAQTRRGAGEGAFKVALQPFSAVRDAVNATPESVANRTPRAAARVAPVAPRALATADQADQDDEEEATEDVYAATIPSARPVRAAKAVSYGEPMRVAYVTAQPVRRAEPAPQAEPADEEEDFSGSAPRDEQAYAADAEKENDFAPEPEVQWAGDRPTVSGSRAVLRNGVAYAPSRAPENVKNAIWAVNALRRKPYRWGGGHASFHDRGYDCSGAVSYALHYAGVLSSPMPSTGFLNYGRRGRGKWITVYSRPGHTFAVIAGLRLDTTDFQRGGNTGPRWHVDGRDTDDFVARHPAGL